LGGGQLWIVLDPLLAYFALEKEKVINKEIREREAGVKGMVLDSC